MTTVVQFSGGIDSLVALWLTRAEPGVCALWVKTDAAYPDTQARVEAACKAAGVPLYIEFTKRDILEYGFPADIVAVDFTPLGRYVCNTSGPIMQSYMECCSRGIWGPMRIRTQALGADVIVRGVKACDKRVVRFAPGSTIEGMRYDMPLYTWTPDDVLAFAKRECVQHIPPYYALGETTSHDCWDCTAYLDENAKRVANLPEDKKRVVQARLRFIASAGREAMSNLQQAGFATMPALTEEVTQ